MLRKSKTILILGAALLSLSACTHTYHVRCWSGGKKVVNENMSRGWDGDWHNSDGDRVFMKNLSCQFRKAE